jgi:stage II sporulation protein D
VRLRPFPGRNRGTAAITGRSIREKLLGFACVPPVFTVRYHNGNFTFITRGYGHGVGLSQYGAQFMALDGYGYQDILTHYYTGTEVY